MSFTNGIEDAFSTNGVMLTPEQKACLSSSLQIKAREADVKELVFWGKLLTTAGKDYLVAQATDKYAVDDVEGVQLSLKSYVSQDGLTWIELEPVDVETAARCATVTTPLTGDIQSIVTVEEAVVSPSSDEEDKTEEGEGEGKEEPEPIMIEIGELVRLSAFVAEISTNCHVVPKGLNAVNAYGNIVPNPGFTGVPFPEKLDSYVKVVGGPNGPSASSDIPGAWSVRTNQLTKTTVLRSLLYPGFVFVYSSLTKTCSSLYFGSGMKNLELPFLL